MVIQDTLISKYAPKAGYPLGRSILFVVDKALGAGVAVQVKRYAQRLMSVSLDRRLPLAILEAETGVVPVNRNEIR